MCKVQLQQKDLQRVEKADYKASEQYKHLHKAARAKRKGYEDKNQEDEDVMYSSGLLIFPNHNPGLENDKKVTNSQKYKFDYIC